MPTKAGHPTDETLEQYSLGQLPERQSEPVEEHLLVCGNCQNRLEEMDEYVAAMRLALGDLENESCPAVAEKVPALKRLLGLPMPVMAGALATVVLAVLTLPWLRTTQAPFALQLQTYRGIEQPAVSSAPAGRALEITLSLAGLSDAAALRGEIADAGGDLKWQGTLEPAEGAATLNVGEPLVAGQYWVRVYSVSQTRSEELLREFSLRVQ